MTTRIESECYDPESDKDYLEDPCEQCGEEFLSRITGEFYLCDNCGARYEGNH